MTTPYTTSEEEYLDDDLLDKLDPYANARWDKQEGPKERAAYKQLLVDRLTPERNTQIDRVLLEIIDLVTEFDDIFSQTPKAPGMAETIFHRIDTTGPPPKTPAMYRRSLPDQELLKEWVQWMLLNGLIRPSTSPYAQNIIIVKKPGKEPRVCIDPRPINKVTQPDPYPMPRMDEIFGSLQGSAVFSLLDAASGFFQVPIVEEHRHLAAFRCETGVFEFCCMPFGLTNAPATFTRWMQMTFQGLDSFLKIYMDDLLIHSSKIEEHPAQLRKKIRKVSRTTSETPSHQMPPASDRAQTTRPHHHSGRSEERPGQSRSYQILGRRKTRKPIFPFQKPDPASKLHGPH